VYCGVLALQFANAELQVSNSLGQLLLISTLRTWIAAEKGRKRHQRDKAVAALTQAVKQGLLSREETAGQQR